MSSGCKTRLLLPWKLPFPAALTADVIAKADLAEQPFANGTGSHPHSFFTFAEGRAKFVSAKPLDISTLWQDSRRV
jgi:hypothetical protein